VNKVTGSVPAGEQMPAQLMEALDGYESALASDDVDLLGAYFVEGDEAMRGDASGLLVGRDQIDRFRGGRGGAPARELGDVQVRPVGVDHAYVTSVTIPARGGRGMVTQLWRRTISDATPGGWVIVAAHVSAPPAALDSRVWRVVGSPLVASPSTGPLSEMSVAVKDLISVRGHAIGGGVPAFLAQSAPQVQHAPALARLVDAGADVAGIAQTDEFAYSIAGRNPHYGTPPNPAVPGGLPGGSSSGPASAVALGHADIGLATDTAGSIRVPASYQGLWGLRPTHEAVSLEGVLPLAPAYDTVGVLARDGGTLLKAATALLGDAPVELPANGDFPIVTSSDFMAPADAAVREHVAALLARLVDAGAMSGLGEVRLPAAADLFPIFRVTQSAEAWRSHGEWVLSHPGALGDDIAARFAWAQAVTAEQEREGLVRQREAREVIDAALGDAILVLPSASSPAPATDSSEERLAQVREATLGMTAAAGMTGRPALSVPLMVVDGAPVGLCLVGPRGSDLALIETALAWQDALQR